MERRKAILEYPLPPGRVIETRTLFGPMSLGAVAVQILLGLFMLFAASSRGLGALVWIPFLSFIGCSLATAGIVLGCLSRQEEDWKRRAGRVGLWMNVGFLALTLAAVYAFFT